MVMNCKALGLLPADALEPRRTQAVRAAKRFAMSVALQVVALMLAAVTMGLSLAHALEFPGKRRLSKEQYLIAQRIYYPGFTVGGLAEPAVIVATLALLTLTPWATQRFWLIAGAGIAFVVVQAIFWLMTQPMNAYWLGEIELSLPARRFFALGRADTTPDWTVARDRWECSHLLRAMAAMLGLFLLSVAVAS